MSIDGEIIGHRSVKPLEVASRVGIVSVGGIGVGDGGDIGDG